MLKKIIRLYYTLKYLRPKQIVWRLLYLFPKFISPVFGYPKLSEYQRDFFFIPCKQITPDYIFFTFLNETYNLNELGWENPKVSKLWLYNLHYFDFLNQSKSSHDQLELQIGIIENWIMNNPFGKGTGWEPYPTSVRIINWIKWHWLTGALTENAKKCLWNQVRWLASRPEYHLLGNHLFINAKALFFASAFFSLDSKSRIYKTASSILVKELDEQFLSDGAHFELSPMYHSLAMQDLLDLLHISKKLPRDFPIDKLLVKYSKGMWWLKTMIYENEELAHFNDCANGVAPTYTELERFADQLRIARNSGDVAKIIYHKESGFIVYKDATSHLIADIGKVGPDYLPGHAHADTLSFELAVRGVRVIVNSGTSIYGGSLERLRQRGTSAHSTVEIDGANSSEVWSGFRVARRANPFNIQVNSQVELNNPVNIQASHDGYKRLKNKPIHTRVFNLINDVWSVEDHVSGNNNIVVARFYLHPEIQIRKNESGIILSKQHMNLVNIKYDSSYELKIYDTTYHDKFGITKSNKCIQIKGISPSKMYVNFEMF